MKLPSLVSLPSSAALVVAGLILGCSSSGGTPSAGGDGGREASPSTDAGRPESGHDGGGRDAAPPSSDSGARDVTVSCGAASEACCEPSRCNAGLVCAKGLCGALSPVDASADVATDGAAVDAHAGHDAADAHAGHDAADAHGGHDAADADSCSNAGTQSLPIDPTGWVSRACDTVGIQGGWYCSADAFGTSDCTSGVVPYAASSGGMCMSGRTSNAPGATGAAIGLQLNVSGDAGSMPSAYDATANQVIGFEITLTGSSGGVAPRLTFTGGAAPSDLQPYVSLPGAGTYQVLFADAVVPASYVGASAGTRANPAALYDVELWMPGEEDVAYDYCITALSPILAGSVTPPTTCGPRVAYGSPVCGAYDLLDEVGAYAVQNDVDGYLGQCVQASSGGTCGGFSVAFTEGLFSGVSAPASYPSIVYGWQAGDFYGGYRTAMQLSAIGSIPTTWSFTTPTPAGGKWNAAYDVWLSPEAAPVTANGGLELMIWPSYGGGAQPYGTLAGTKVIAGSTWQVWKGSVTVGTSSWQYLAYRLPSPSSAPVSLDLEPFVTDAVSEGVGLTTSAYLLGVQAGFQVWASNAGQTMATTSYTAAVQ